VFAVPGILVAILLWFTAPRISAMEKTDSGPLMPVLHTSWFELVKVILIVACRSLTYFGLIAFLPLYLQTQNISIADSNHFLFIMLFASSLRSLALSKMNADRVLGFEGLSRKPAA